jgi:PhzF family phenazine biosynthesis protein
MTNVTLSLVQVDVFTSRPLSGNAAAIVFDADGLDGATMQAIARETNLSETVFVLAPYEGGDYRARIFTTRREIAFAVHPTIAAAHAVAEQRGLASGGLVQECDIGLVPVARGQDVPGWAARVPEPRFSPVDLDRFEAADCLGLAHDHISVRPIERVATGPHWIMIELTSPDALSRLDRDHRAMARVSRRCEAVGFTVFVRNPAPGVDAHLRAFAPAEGIFEDPVCGSCAGSLAALLSRDDPHAGRAAPFLFEQGREIGRPGQLYARVRPDGLVVGGEAVSVLRGTLDIGV